MNTPTLTVKATRIVSTQVDDGYIIVAFLPAKSTLKAFKDVEGSLAIIDLDDELGLWSNGRTFEIVDVNTSEDQRAMSIRVQA